ncbi:MAG TPA: SPASM domain-containing protein [Candidatus Binataceae bacterium]|nr:SPASM domain-containing protein [Candidatus Binataceae bacterium]
MNIDQCALAAYQNQVAAMRKSPYLDFPAHVHLETNALCNAACNFCPYPTLERRGARMPDALISKIIEDLRDIPRTLPFQLSPFKVNEPFLDTRLFSVLAQINERLPNASLGLTTNASPLTEKQLTRLGGVRNLAYLWISMNDHREAEYEAAMQLPYRRTIERLQMIHDARAAGHLALRVILSRVGDGTVADLEFVQWAKSTYPLFEASVFLRGNWLSQVDTATAPAPRVGCVRWFDLSITATGIVAHCCMDGAAKYPIGDVTRRHVLEVYNAPAYRKLRERTATRQDAEPCNRCSFL